MKRLAPVMALLAAAAYISTTGFQCGSAEMTSAKLYRDQKQYDKAEASCLKELAKNDKNEEAWFILGQVRYEQRKYAGMNDAFTHALAVSDVHKVDIGKYRLSGWAGSVNEGVGFFNRGRDTATYFNNALEEFKTAIRLEPDSAKTYQLAGMSEYALGDYENAVAFYDTALMKNPGFFDVASSLGRVHYLLASRKESANDAAGATQEYAAAAKAFEQACKAAPDSAEYVLNLIDAYDRSKQPDKAMELTKNAVAREGNNKVFHYAYGVFLLKQAEADAKAENYDAANAHYAECVAQFQKAVDLDPEYTDAIYNLGVSNLNWGVALKTQADKKAESGKKGAKPSAAEEAAYKDKFRAALPHLVKSTELRPNDATLWTTLGRIYAILNMPDKSKDAFEKADRLAKAK